MQNAHAAAISQVRSPSELSIDGTIMKALKIAYDEFAKSGKDIQDFTLSISKENDKNENHGNEVYVVTFMGKLLPGKTRGLGTANRIPGSVTYFVSAEKWTISKEQGVR